MAESIRKRDVTRERILAAANARFAAGGYEQTTTASIADDAGVTERTFFRYFPTKSAVLVANWEGHSEALRLALSTSERIRVADVVRDGLVAFTDRLQLEIDGGLDSVMRLYADRAAFLVITQMLLDLETQLASEIARRSSRSIDDVDVRVAANCSFGVFRAAVRTYATGNQDESMSEVLTKHLRPLRSTFSHLQS